MSSNPVQSIGDQIASRLRGELLSGQYQPGTPLREEVLAERFGVSRLPIRHVLQSLAHEGLLIAKRNCGMTVAAPPGEILLGLLNPLRIQIETYALRLSLPRLVASQSAEFKPIMDRMIFACQQKDDALVIDTDFSFHQMILTEAGLVDIVPVWQGVVGRMRDHHIQSNQRFPDYGFIPFVHQRLLEVFQMGEVDSAIEALTSHIQNGDFNDRGRQAWNTRR